MTKAKTKTRAKTKAKTAPKAEAYKTIFDIPLDTIIEIRVPQNAVSVEGQEAIRKYLIDWLGGEYMPKVFDWDWVIIKGPLTGTLPKRIARYLYKERDIRLDPSALTEIGNLAQRHADKTSLYRIDLTQSIDWKVGDFGDFGSCFFGGRAEAMPMLKTNKAFAFRYWKNSKDYSEIEISKIVNGTDDGGCHHKRHERCLKCQSLIQWKMGKKRPDGLIGRGRTWVAPIQGQVVLFNTYGDFQTITSARLLATLLGHSYKSVGLLNNGEGQGRLWINGSTGYLVGPAAAIQKIERLDLRWKELKRRHCGACNRTESHYGEYDTIAEGVLCPSCSEKKRCPGCSKIFRSYQMSEMGRGNLAVRVCRKCLDTKTSECPGCGTRCLTERMMPVKSFHTEINMCRNCHDESPACRSCGDHVLSLIENKCRVCFYKIGEHEQEKSPQAQEIEAGRREGESIGDYLSRINTITFERERNGSWEFTANYDPFHIPLPGEGE